MSLGLNLDTINIPDDKLISVIRYLKYNDIDFIVKFGKNVSELRQDELIKMIQKADISFDEMLINACDKRDHDKVDELIRDLYFDQEEELCDALEHCEKTKNFEFAYKLLKRYNRLQEEHDNDEMDNLIKACGGISS